MDGRSMLGLWYLYCNSMVGLWMIVYRSYVAPMMHLCKRYVTTPPAEGILGFIYDELNGCGSSIAINPYNNFSSFVRQLFKMI